MSSQRKICRGQHLELGCLSFSLWWLHHMVWSIISSISSAFLLSIQWGMGLGWKSQALSHDLVFLVTSPLLETHWKVISLKQDSYCLWNYKGFKNLVLDSPIIQEIVRNLCQRLNVTKKILLALLFLKV